MSREFKCRFPEKAEIFFCFKLLISVLLPALLIDLDFAFSFANTLLPRESLSNVKLRTDMKIANLHFLRACRSDPPLFEPSLHS